MVHSSALARTAPPVSGGPEEEEEAGACHRNGGSSSGLLLLKTNVYLRILFRKSAEKMIMNDNDNIMFDTD